MSDAPVDRVVVGAGLCGLATAWRSVCAGRSTSLLEASPRVGGVLKTEWLGPWRVERAAAAFPSTATHLLELHASLPRPPVIRKPPAATSGQFLWTRNGLREMPRTPPALVASSLLGFGAKARLFSEFLRRPRRSGPPESAYAFARRRLGRAVAERFLRPMTLGIYGTRPEDLGIADAFPTLPAMEADEGGVLRALRRRQGAVKREVWTFEDGMEALPKAIAEALGASVVKTSNPVADTLPVADSIELRFGDGTRVRAREVVLATTAPEQARLVASFAPDAAALLSSVRYVPMVVASVGLAPALASKTPSAFGFLRASGAPGRILGAAFASNLNPAVAPAGHALWNVFLGGGADPDAGLLSDDDVRDVVERDLSTVLGTRVELAFISIARWPRAIPVFSIGHRERMARADEILAPNGLRLSGSHVTGVGVHSCAGAGA